MSNSIETVELKFRMGEITFWTARLRLEVIKKHFTEYKAPYLNTEDPGDSINNKAEGIFFRSRPISTHLPRFTLKPHVIRYIPRQYHRYYIDLTSTQEQYLEKFSSKSRSTLKRKLRKFSEYCHGEIDWREYKTPADMEVFYPLARQVSKQTYQERVLAAGLPEDESFVQQMQTLAQQDSVRAYLLFHQDMPIAYLYCPAVNSILIYQYLGYIPAMAEWSPGTILQWIALEKLFHEDRFKMFDFTEGPGKGTGGHKEFFATGSVRCADIYFMKKTLGNLVTVFLHAYTDSLSAQIGAGLDRLGLKTKIKNIMRRLRPVA
jgi:hypothetical protein